MIAFEALFTFITAMAFITLIGRPLARAYSEKVQSLPHNMTAAEQKALLDRVATLEFELAELRHNIVALQDSAEFAIKMLEDKNLNKIDGSNGRPGPTNQPNAGNPGSPGGPGSPGNPANPASVDNLRLD